MAWLFRRRRHGKHRAPATPGLGIVLPGVALAAHEIVPGVPVAPPETPAIDRSEKPGLVRLDATELAEPEVCEPEMIWPEDPEPEPAELVVEVLPAERAAGLLADPAPATLPSPRVAADPEFMPLPARVVLCFEDGTQQVVTPLSDEAERMRATAERLMGVGSDRSDRRGTR